MEEQPRLEGGQAPGDQGLEGRDRRHCSPGHPAGHHGVAAVVLGIVVRIVTGVTVRGGAVLSRVGAVTRIAIGVVPKARIVMWGGGPFSNEFKRSRARLEGACRAHTDPGQTLPHGQDQENHRGGEADHAQ